MNDKQVSKNIIQMSGKPVPRSHTVDKHRKYDDPNKFLLENVVIDQEAKSPRYLTSFSASGMRRLTETQKKSYDTYLKSKDPRQIKPPQYFQIANDKKIENVHPSKKQRQSRHLNQEDNDYQTNEFIKNKIGGGALVDKHKNYFKQYDQKRHDLNSFKKDIEGVVSQRVQKKQEDKNEEALKDSMVSSTLNLADKAMQVINKIEDPRQVEFPKQVYFDNQFHFLYQQVKNLGQFFKLLEKPRQYQKIDEKPTSHETSSSNKLKAQLKQVIIAKSILEREKNTFQIDYENMRLKYEQSELKRKEVELKNKELAKQLDDTTNQLKGLKTKYNDVCRMYEQLQRQSIKQTHAKASQLIQRKPVQIKFYSSLAIENNITAFLNRPIQSLTKKHLKASRLIYQKDDFNTNITNYLDRLPFPLVILFNTGKNNVFGVFAEGIQSYRTNQMKENKTFERAFKVFLFNATNKMIFERDQKSKVTCGLSYFENHLKFGNNQLVLKNNALVQLKILGSSIFGEKYFILPKRHLLTGVEAETIQIKEMEIFEVILSDI